MGTTKTIKIKFNGLASGTTADVEVQYSGDTETFINNDVLLEETQSLYNKANNFALTKTVEKTLKK